MRSTLSENEPSDAGRESGHDPARLDTKADTGATAMTNTPQAWQEKASRSVSTRDSHGQPKPVWFSVAMIRKSKQAAAKEGVFCASRVAAFGGSKMCSRTPRSRLFASSRPRKMRCSCDPPTRAAWTPRPARPSRTRDWLTPEDKVHTGSAHTARTPHATGAVVSQLRAEVERERHEMKNLVSDAVKKVEARHGMGRRRRAQGRRDRSLPLGHRFDRALLI